MKNSSPSSPPRSDIVSLTGKILICIPPPPKCILTIFPKTKEHFRTKQLLDENFITTKAFTNIVATINYERLIFLYHCCQRL